MAICLVVEVDPDSHPLTGWVSQAEIAAATGSDRTDGADPGRRRFCGWTEFSLAIEACLAQTGGRPPQLRAR